MRIYLIGYMGAGKTTLSKKLANLLGYNYIDLDQMFEERYKIEIDSFFKKYDEKAFRNIESQLLKETASLNSVVIATGGGTPCYHDNMSWMNQHGITVYLEMHPRSLFKRLILSKKKRPLVLSHRPAELLLFIKNHLVERNKFYNQAAIIIKGEDIDPSDLHQRILKFQERN
ncbi:MAG: shikimate kinase [Bacteroidales bacterium]|nr:shikimate kinase [Bacteroidales bacterium]